jgi:adenylate cyclase, class 2
VGETGQEIEVKFYTPDLVSIESRLQAAGYSLGEPRVHEFNLRFDTPDRALTGAQRILRLRKDRQVHLTYKGPGIDEEGVRKRHELEVTVSSFETCRAVLEALGYEVSFIYEKYRTTYQLQEILVALDETPFGNFVEVEGPSSEKIREAARQLGLDWDERILHSYIFLFNRVQKTLQMRNRDLTFENFKDQEVSAKMLGVSPAV